MISTSATTRYLSPEDWTVRPQGSWKSPDGTRYPSRWTLILPSENIECDIEPLILDQENRSLDSSLAYWEGAVDIRSKRGDVIGKGYVELTGYGDQNGLRF